MHAPIHNSFKGNRVPENNSNQGGGRKLSTVKSFNFLKKEIEKDTKNEKTAHGHGLQNSNCENDHYVKSNLQIQCNPDKKFQSHSSQKYFKKYPRIYLELQKTRASQSNSERKNSTGEITIPRPQDILQRYSNKNSTWLALKQMCRPKEQNKKLKHISIAI